LLLGAESAVVQAQPLARITGLGIGQEKGHRYSKKPYRGDGLTDVFMQLFESQDTSNNKIKTVYADLNRESFFAKEWGVPYTRYNGRFIEDFQIEHPVDCFGDLGAALAPVLIGLAAIASSKNDAGASFLIWCSSDSEGRGAVTVICA